jgi:hypothetical protein
MLARVMPSTSARRVLSIWKLRAEPQRLTRVRSGQEWLAHHKDEIEIFYLSAG